MVKIIIGIILILTSIYFRQFFLLIFGTLLIVWGVKETQKAAKQRQKSAVKDQSRDEGREADRLIKGLPWRGVKGRTEIMGILETQKSHKEQTRLFEPTDFPSKTSNSWLPTSPQHSDTTKPNRSNAMTLQRSDIPKIAKEVMLTAKYAVSLKPPLWGEEWLQHEIKKAINQYLQSRGIAPDAIPQHVDPIIETICAAVVQWREVVNVKDMASLAIFVSEGVRSYVARSVGDRTGEGMAIVNLGLAHANLGQVGKAVALLEEAWQIGQATKNDLIIQRTSQALQRLGFTKTSSSSPIPTSPDVSPRINQPTPTKLLDKLWHVEDGFEIKSLVERISSEEISELVAAIDLTNVPLNAFCTESFNFKSLDDRMVTTIILAFSLLETGKNYALMPLLDKIAEKFKKKLMIGSSRKGPPFESNDPWLIGESLMLRMHGLAMELLKKPDTKMYHYSKLILEATLLDYPDRLESRFWLAAAWNNIYLHTKDQETKKSALKAIDSFLTAAEGHTDYQEKAEIFKKIRSTKY